MIAFGSLITKSEPYRAYARPGIDRAAEPDSEVFVISSVGTVGRGCNLLLDTAAAHDDLEALVLLHPHAEIDDPRFCEKVRAALTDPDVAVVGAAGSSGRPSLAWWDGDITAGDVTLSYPEHRGGRLPAYSWKPLTPAPAEVDVVDGFLMVLSPWAVRNARFDESLALGHGFDVDFCHQVRQAGKKVAVADLAVVHHHSLDLFDDGAKWIEAHIQLADKWDRTTAENDEAGWKARARRAEAEREAERAITYSLELSSDARVLSLERELQEALESRAWRMTGPLRALNAALRRRRERPPKRPTDNGSAIRI